MYVNIFLRATYYTIPFIKTFRVNKSMDRVHISGSGAGRGCRGDVLLNGCRLLMWADKHDLELDRGGGCTAR